MSDKQNEQEKKNIPWPSLPQAIQHQMSMKWATMEALRILQLRLKARNVRCRVLLFTTLGLIRGELADIADTYEETVDVTHATQVDCASATAHLRAELWNMYSEKDKALTSNDSGAIIHVRNASVDIGDRHVQIPHLAVFAGDVCAFAFA